MVDDVADQRLITVGMLERLGYKATAVDSGEAALEALAKGPFDLLILDMVMDPGIDGLEAYRRCIALNPDQRAVIASGYSQTERVKAAQQLGHCLYIKKPFLLDTLRQIVGQALNDRGTTIDHQRPKPAKPRQPATDDKPGCPAGLVHHRYRVSARRPVTRFAEAGTRWC